MRLVDPEALRTRVTRAMRPLDRATEPATKAEEVERFFEAEHVEDRALERWGEMYTGRPLKELDVDAPFAPSESPRASIADELTRVSMDEIGARTTRMRELVQTMQLLQRALAGGVRDEALVVGGKRLARNEVAPRLQMIEREMKALDEEFAALDEGLLRVHAKMAQGTPRAAELRDRYALILRLQKPLVSVREGLSQVARR